MNERLYEPMGTGQDSSPRLLGEPSTKGSVLLVGNFFLSQTGPCPVCEELADHLADSGWSVITTSLRRKRAERLIDMVATAWKRRKDYEIAQVDLFGGASVVWAEAVCRVLRLLKKPHVLTLHGGSLPDLARRQPARIRRLLRSADAVTAPSRYMQAVMSPYRDDIRRIPNPVAFSDYPYRLRERPRPRLIWLRAFHENYNPTLVPRVTALLADEFPDLRVVMVGPDKGDGTLEKTRDLAADLGIADRITIVGPVPKSEVPRWIDKGDVFLNTPLLDNAPVTVLEALSCGTCVVSTEVGGIPYLLDQGSDALLVPSDDAPAMAAAVRRILTEPNLSARLSRNARGKAEESDWSAVIPRWEDLLGEIRGGSVVPRERIRDVPIPGE